MDKLIFPSLLLLSVAISYISAECCGTGSHGFCDDCTTVVSLLSIGSGSKCCGKNACNVFCCDCTCRTGNPTINYHSGFLWSKKYSCKKGDTESERDRNQLQDTWEAFHSLDKDGDNAISQNEFEQALRTFKNEDFGNSLLASNLLQTDDQNEIEDLLDTVQSDEFAFDDDYTRTVEREYRAMDANGDGLIQAEEFDKDLKKLS